jgi:hypothetical protein
MEIRVMWISSIRVLRRYADERFAWGQFLSMALFLVLASLAAGRKTSVLGLTLELALACSFLFQFRLWDDLADRAIDRLDHPERFLAQARSVRIFEWFTAVLGLLNFGFIAALRSHPVPLTTWVALNLGFLGWYAWRPDPAIHRLLNAHVILLKYPAFVLLLASVAAFDGGAVFALTLGLVYLSFTAHELLHDPLLQRSPGAGAFLILEMLSLWALSLALIPLAGADRPATIDWLAGCVALSATLLAVLFSRRARPAAAWLKRTVFAPVLLQLLLIAFR